MVGACTVQCSHLDYDRKGAIIRMRRGDMETPFVWAYDDASGFLKQLTYPNGMIRKNSFHSSLNLMVAINYEDSENGSTVARHSYQYDMLMRPIQRQDFRKGATLITTREFTYNDRSELTEDRLGQLGNFYYQYDNIGNRKIARELEKEVSYDSNRLNQYTDITKVGISFIPAYDSDGNQTSIRTSTGVWNVSYDANDRPVSFTSEDSRIFISCSYDYMGRRFEKKVSVNNTTIYHTHYLYRGYLQIAELDMMHPMPMLVKSYLWEPSETIATRILMMTLWKENGTEVKEHLYFMHDMMKNVTSIFGEQREKKARYEYSPFGSILSAEGNMAQFNKFRFSCEFIDDELDLVYYNYRHLNPADGRWINRDPIAEKGGIALYVMVDNSPTNWIDRLGLNLYAIDGTWSDREDNHNTKRLFDLSLESPKYYWEGPNWGVTGLDASSIYRGVKKQICSDYCNDKNISINLVGWSRGATIAMEVAEELEDDGCCCNKKTEYPKVNWLGLFDAVDMTITWGWANDITSNVKNASHIIKSENQLLFPTSSAKAEDPNSTNLTTVQLENSTHGDVGATSDVALHWMVDQATRAGVKMQPVERNWIIK